MDGNNPFFLKEGFMKYIEAKKRYGQNFLKSREVLESIASVIEIQKEDLVIEIGPGMGALTAYLYQKNSFLLCYEIDIRMKEYLEKYNTDRSKVIFTDFLKQEVEEDMHSFPYQNVYVVANIPYYITSPIISKLLEISSISEIVLLVQKEVAERIVANSHSKDYNAFTLFIDYFYDATLLFSVDRNHFVPAPKVDSAVVHLVRKKYVPVEDKSFYFQFIKDAFSSKRKTLKNNLKSYDWKKIKSILFALGYTENVRAEEIKKEDFYVLAAKYSNK